MCAMRAVLSPVTWRRPGRHGNKPVTLDTDPNLVGWWKFDETAGNIAADSSGHKRDGTLKGDLSFDKNSAPGKAARPSGWTPKMP